MPAFALTALRHWKLIGMGLLCLLLAVQTVRLGAAHNKIESQQIRLKELVADRDKLLRAAKEAERLNKEQVSRIVNEQDRISKDVEADLTARLERLRRELRSKANNGNSSGSQASPNGKAPGTVDGATGLCLAAPDVLRAAENEERHDQLITWVREQLGVKR